MAVGCAAIAVVAPAADAAPAAVSDPEDEQPSCPAYLTRADVGQASPLSWLHAFFPFGGLMLNAALCDDNFPLVMPSYFQAVIVIITFVVGHPPALCNRVCAIEFLRDDALFTLHSSEVLVAGLLLVHHQLQLTMTRLKIIC